MSTTETELETPDVIVCAESNPDGTYAGWCGVEHASEKEAAAHIAGELDNPAGGTYPALGDAWEVSSTHAIDERRASEAEAAAKAAADAEAAAVAEANAPGPVDPGSVEGRLRALEAAVGITPQAVPEAPAAEDDVPPYDEWTKEELHAELEARELPVSGTKAEQVERLEADDAAAG